MDTVNSKYYITETNKKYKSNIKKIAKKNKNFTLKDLSKELGYADNYISNMCNKDSTILSNNLLHKISTTLNCTLIELNEDLWFFNLKKSP
mgnify:FL=1